MFRRTKSEPDTPDVTVAKPGGKGRPTPSRREAEAAAKARAKAPRDKKAARKLLRESRAAENAKIRQGMKTGDDRYLPARDQGKVRRFVRDRVDSRISMAEFLIVFLLAVMVLTSTGNETLVRYGNALWTATILLVAVDTTFLVIRVKRELRKRFPDESHKGAGFYAVLRALQFRFLRLPKPKVKIGQKLPERY